MSIEQNINQNISIPNQPEELDEIEVLELMRQDALNILVRENYISYAEDGQVVADVEKLSQYSTAQTNDSVLAWNLRNIYGSASFSVLQEIFHEEPVVSHEDWDNGIRQSKSLFYDPISDEAALDKRAISESNFYLNPTQGNRKFDFPELDEVNDKEAALALLTYHPNYGNGFRDPKSGQLMVKDLHNHYEPISYDYFINNFHYNPRIENRTDGGFAGSPKKFFQGPGQHLIQSGVFNENDFVSMRREANPDIKEVDQNGFVYLGGIRYFIGKAHANETKVRVLGNTAIVASGPEEKITSYFKLKPDLKVDDQSLVTLNEAQTDLQPFERSNFLKRQNSEPLEDYRVRVEGLNDFELKPIRTSELTTEMKAKMRSISLDNWSKLDNQALAQRVMTDFDSILDSDQESKFYFGQMNGEILGFMRTQEEDDPNRLYVGSLNVDWKSQRATIGASFFRQTIDRLSRTKIIDCTVYPKLPVIQQYFESGFVVRGLRHDHRSNTKLFAMELDRSKNNNYQFIHNHQESASYFNDNQYNLEDQIIVLKYNQPQYEEMLDEVDHILSSGGHTLTAYFNLPSEPGLKCLVLEKNGSQPEENQEGYDEQLQQAA